MIGFLLTFCLYVTIVFLTIIPLFGISYTSSEESPIYLIAVIGSNLFSIGYIFWQELRNHKQGRGPVWPYFIPVAILFVYASEMAFGDMGETANKMVTAFCASAASAIWIGVYCYRFDKFHLLAKNLEVLALISTAGLIVSLPQMYSEGEYSTIGGGGGHQTISYVAAICCSIFLIGANLKKSESRFRYKIFSNEIYKKIALLLAVVNIVICIVGGGRGGAVLLIVNVIATFFYLLRTSFWKTSAVAVLGCLLFYAVSSNISVWGIDRMFATGFERAFSFIASSGIDMSETSDRNIVYAVAVQLIEVAPFFGYGVFHQYDLCQQYMSQPYSHNLFYELLLQGGILYLIFWLVICWKTMLRIHRLILRGSYYNYLIPIASYPFIMLMFSGTYLVSSVFWFSVVFAYGAYGKRADKHTANMLRKD